VGTNNLDTCIKQGAMIGNEIKRLSQGATREIKASPNTRYARIDVPFDKPRTRAEREERAGSGDYAVAYHAKLNLARLDRGESLPTKMTYPIQTWVFGEQLALPRRYTSGTFTYSKRAGTCRSAR
jgi:hypothetical protein